jgi:hypothetical protein
MNTGSRRNHSTAVGIETACRLDDRWVTVPVLVLTSQYCLDRNWDPKTSYKMGTGWGISLGVWWQVPNFDHSTPTTAEVKIKWIYTSTTPIRSHESVLKYLSTKTTLLVLPIIGSRSLERTFYMTEFHNCFFSPKITTYIRRSCNQGQYNGRYILFRGHRWGVPNKL